ncbi:MAG TPA: hypothetical protein VIJ59_09165, partial [Caulobacteraceae bacterium]
MAVLGAGAFALAASSQIQTPAASPANAAMINQGRYLVAVGDCESCHTRAGGPALAGGFALNTPFGVIYS